MKSIKLTKLQKEELQDIIIKETKRRPVKRAQAVLYKSKGMETKSIAKEINEPLKTVYGWLKRFANNGIESIPDKAGRGRKSILKEQDKELTTRILKETLNIKATCSRLCKCLEIKHLHPQTLKNFLKRNRIQLQTI